MNSINGGGPLRNGDAIPSLNFSTINIDDLPSGLEPMPLTQPPFVGLIRISGFHSSVVEILTPPGDISTLPGVISTTSNAIGIPPRQSQLSFQGDESSALNGAGLKKKKLTSYPVPTEIPHSLPRQRVISKCSLCADCTLSRIVTTVGICILGGLVTAITASLSNKDKSKLIIVVGVTATVITAGMVNYIFKKRCPNR